MQALPSVSWSIMAPGPAGQGLLRLTPRHGAQALTGCGGGLIINRPAACRHGAGRGRRGPATDGAGGVVPIGAGAAAIWSGSYDPAGLLIAAAGSRTMRLQGLADPRPCSAGVAGRGELIGSSARVTKKRSRQATPGEARSALRQTGDRRGCQLTLKAVAIPWPKSS